MATPHDDAAGIKVENISASRTRQCPQCGLSVPGTVETCPNDGAPLVKKLKPGDFLLGRYEFIEVIGEGGMGVVYKARHPDLKRIYAIKMLHSHLAGINAAGRFLQEAQAASGLDHPNIITIHDYSTDAGARQFIVMDFLEGQDLASRIEESGALPVEDALSIFWQICDGLAHAHKKGVVHRDLKPSNIVLCKNHDGLIVPKLVDFGLAKVLSEEGGNDGASSGPALTRTGDVLGSPPYMSPEQCKGLALDARTDIYSLGCLMFEALTGKPPFMANSTMALVFKHMEEPAPTLASAAPDRKFAPALESLIAKCLAKRRADRFQTMEEVQRAVEAVRRGSWALSPNQKRWLTIGSATISGIALIALGAFLFGGKHEAPAASVKSVKQDSEVIQAAVNGYFDGRKFEMHSKQCTNSWMPFVAKLPTLRLMSLSHTAVTDQGLRAFANSKAPLEQVDLEELQGVSDDGMKSLSHFPLRYLNIQQTDVGDEGLGDIAKIKTLEDLQCARIDMTRKGLEQIATLPNLKTLDITQMPNFRPDWFDVIAKLKSLDTLDVEGDTIGGGLAKLAGMRTLRALSMHEIPATEENENFVSYLPVMPSLKGVDLHENTLRADDLKALTKQPNLVQLDLGACKFVTGSGRDIEPAPQILAIVAGCKKLQYVYLSQSSATKDGVMALKDIKTLKGIALVGCENISPDEALQIKRAFAPVEVITEKEKKIL